MIISKKKFIVGVIGLGVGSHHLNAFENNKDSVVKIVCDFDNKKLIKFKKSEVIFTNTYETILITTLSLMNLWDINKSFITQII